MYTNEDLDAAIKAGILEKDSVTSFRQFHAKRSNTTWVDEENFRLISGFNDIFVVIASGLFIFSVLWILKPINETLAYAIFIGLTWILSEFFVRKRKLALPAILLLFTFVGGIFAFSLSLFSGLVNPQIFAISALAGAGGALLHWLRFRVPITVAIGTFALGVSISIVLVKLYSISEGFLLTITFIQGILVFMLAMFWDSSDRERLTSKSDVAFWLHLLAAPLIIHPLFYNLGMLNQSASIQSVAIVILLYVLMTMISLIIDRRAFMISSIIYVLYAFSALIKEYGSVDYNFSLTGVFMGGLLLFLSAYWHSARKLVISWLPVVLKKYLPVSR